MTNVNNLKYTNEGKRKHMETEEINSCSVESQQFTPDRSNGKEGMKL